MFCRRSAGELSAQEIEEIKTQIIREHFITAEDQKLTEEQIAQVLTFFLNVVFLKSVFFLFHLTPFVPCLRTHLTGFFWFVFCDLKLDLAVAADAQAAREMRRASEEEVRAMAKTLSEVTFFVLFFLLQLQGGISLVNIFLVFQEKLSFLHMLAGLNRVAPWPTCKSPPNRVPRDRFTRPNCPPLCCAYCRFSLSVCVVPCSFAFLFAFCVVFLSARTVRCDSYVSCVSGWLCPDWFVWAMDAGDVRGPWCAVGSLSCTD